MREPISSNPASGTTRFQVESPAQSFIELLGVADYERVPVAEVSWQQARPMADVLKEASELAFLMEARRRGYEVAGKILDGKHYNSGKRIHRRKQK